MATQPPPQETMVEYLARMLRQSSPTGQPQQPAGSETPAGYAARLFQESAGHPAPPPPPGFPYRTPGTTSPYDAGLDAGGTAPYPSPPRGVATPDNQQPIITPGLSKDTLTQPGFGFNPATYDFLGMGGWKQSPYRASDPEADARVAAWRAPFAADAAPHIRFTTPNSGGEQAYDQSNGNGIRAFAGGDFMGAQGRPGGGAFSMNALPITGKTVLGRPEFDWSSVANPEAFSAYTDANRDASIAAQRARDEALAKNPWAEKESEAKAWVAAQLALNEGIANQLQNRYLAAVSQIRDDVAKLPPDKQLDELKRRLADLDANYTAIYGNRGAASAVHVTGSPLIK